MFREVSFMSSSICLVRSYAQTPFTWKQTISILSCTIHSILRNRQQNLCLEKVCAMHMCNNLYKSVIWKVGRDITQSLVMHAQYCVHPNARAQAWELILCYSHSSPVWRPGSVLLTASVWDRNESTAVIVIKDEAQSRHSPFSLKEFVS